MEEAKQVDTEIVEDDALDLRRPDVPITVEEIAALGTAEADEVIKARVQIIETLRKASIKQTHPSDWVLYKDIRTGRVLAYLEDKGAQRLMPLWGVEIVRLTAPEKITDTNGEYAYMFMGDGQCKVTRQQALNVEGVRYSTERYATEKNEGIEREVAVRKAARANLEGRIVRALTGLNGVPMEEIAKIMGMNAAEFEGKASKGRGYGTQDERTTGATKKQHDIPDEDIPKCDVCNIPLVFRPGSGGKEPFFGCKNWDKHKETKVIVNLSQAKKISEEKQKLKAEAKAETPREPGSDDK